ncbi:hypothetical protein [Candidatus Avelusimicrobium alvi]|uniref:hypothetical protein n=1 Tax=Candidatus Avelusimicrobium alvi TaxID=3416221 RepID=UPI003D0DEC9F
MKNIKLFLAALFAVAIAAPAFAQSRDPHANEQRADNKAAVSAAIERAAVKAARDHRASLCPKCHKAYTIDEKYHGVKHECDAKAKTADKKACTCCACGEEITSAGQHCPAAGYTSLCSASAEQNRQTAPCDTQTVCPKCHKAYTIDEKYHGVQHECSGGNGGEPETGWYFVEIATPASTSPNGGEPETEFFCVHASEASAAEGGEPQAPFFCEVDVDALYRAEELLQADRDAHDGYAVHTLEYYYEQTAGKAPAKNDQKTAKLKKAKTEYCIYCGEAILKDGQVCTAQGYGCRCTTSCPDCGQNLRDPRHTINGEHRCKFKTRIKVAPIKKPAK